MDFTSRLFARLPVLTRKREAGEPFAALSALQSVLMRHVGIVRRLGALKGDRARSGLVRRHGHGHGRGRSFEKRTAIRAWSGQSGGRKPEAEISRFLA